MNLEQLKKNVETVVDENSQAEQAERERSSAEALLLEKVIELVRAGIRAVGDRPKISYEVRHHGDVNYGGGVSDSRRYNKRCLLLSATTWEPDEDCPRANSGSVSDRKLALREDGVLICLEYSGSFSRWQGSSFGWDAEITEYLSAEAALNDGWDDVDEYIERIDEVFARSMGGRNKWTKRMFDRAEKINAIAALI